MATQLLGTSFSQSGNEITFIRVLQDDNPTGIVINYYDWLKLCQLLGLRPEMTMVEVLKRIAIGFPDNRTRNKTNIKSHKKGGK